MISQIVNINLFLIPLITVWLFYFKKENKKFGVSMLGNYALSVALNMILCKAAFAFIRLFMPEKVITLDSTYYTLISLIVAVILALLYRLIAKNVKIGAYEPVAEEKNEK